VQLLFFGFIHRSFSRVTRFFSQLVETPAVLVLSERNNDYSGQVRNIDKNIILRPNERPIEVPEETPGTRVYYYYHRWCAQQN